MNRGSKFFLFILFLSSACISDELDERISYISDMPYCPEYSGDSLYWDIVKDGLVIVPQLIDKLNDSTTTELIVPLWGGYYTVADISHLLIWNIIQDVPILDLVGSTQEERDQDGYGCYWAFVRKDYQNRIILQSRIRHWFEKNKDNLVWKKELRVVEPNDRMYPVNHPAGGYFILKEK